MKKILIVILILLFCFLLSIIMLYTNYKSSQRQTQKHNQYYENYFQKEVYGTDVATIINKAIDNNEKNHVPKNDQGIYQNNGQSSIQIELKFIDSDDTYSFEVIYNMGIAEFVFNFNVMKFKCTKMDYHEQTGQISYMYFEEIL